MAAQDTHFKIDLIGFNLKMLAKGKQRSLLISTGSQEDKEYLLDACRKMAELGVGLYATPGTHHFLAKMVLNLSRRLGTSRISAH